MSPDMETPRQPETRGESAASGSSSPEVNQNELTFPAAAGSSPGAALNTSASSFAEEFLALCERGESDRLYDMLDQLRAELLKTMEKNPHVAADIKRAKEAIWDGYTIYPPQILLSVALSPDGQRHAFRVMVQLGVVPVKEMQGQEFPTHVFGVPVHYSFFTGFGFHGIGFYKERYKDSGGKIGVVPRGTSSMAFCHAASSVGNDGASKL